MKKSVELNENVKTADAKNKARINAKSGSVLTLFDACNKSLKDLQSLEKKTSNKLKELEKMVF